MMAQDRLRDWESEIVFPLTLSLCLRERELPMRGKQASGAGFVSRRRTVLPLPSGEGRGDGKCPVFGRKVLKKPRNRI